MNEFFNQKVYDLLRTILQGKVFTCEKLDLCVTRVQDVAVLSEKGILGP